MRRELFGGRDGAGDQPGLSLLDLGAVSGGIGCALRRNEESKGALRRVRFGAGNAVGAVLGVLRDESREFVAFAGVAVRPGRGGSTDTGGGDTEALGSVPR